MPCRAVFYLPGKARADGEFPDGPTASRAVGRFGRLAGDLSGRRETHQPLFRSPFHVFLRLAAPSRRAEVSRSSSPHLGAQARNADKEVSLNVSGGPHGSSACLAERLTGNLTSPSQAAIREERKARLHETLNGMDAIDREILALRHFEELGNNEVAEILGLSKTAASNRYVRALKHLKDLLSGMAEFQSGE